MMSKLMKSKYSYSLNASYQHSGSYMVEPMSKMNAYTLENYPTANPNQIILPLPFDKIIR